MIWVDLVNGNLEHLAVGRDELDELVVGNPVDFPVGGFYEFSLLSTDVFELLKCDVGLVGLAKIYYFLGELAASGLDKVGLVVLKFLELLSRVARTLIREASELLPSFEVSSLPDGYIPAEVNLFENLAGFGVVEGNRSKGGRADVDAEDSVLGKFCLWKLLFKDDGDFSGFKNRNVVEGPAVFEERVESLELFVKFDWDNKSFSWRVGNLKAGILSLRLHTIKPALVKTDRAMGKPVLDFLSSCPDIFACFLNKVGGEEGGFAYV